MRKQDTLLIISAQTNFEEIEFVRKEALLDWIKTKLSNRQEFTSGEAEYGYKNALKDMENYLREYES
jgi:hypothetical protein